MLKLALSRRVERRAWLYSKQHSSKLDKRSVINDSLPCILLSSDEMEDCISETRDWKSTVGTGGVPEGICSPGCQNLSGDSLTVVTRL